jgi:post-segregation antitoxin (ccd killing protein)
MQTAYWREENKKGRAEFGSAFFTYGSLNAVVLVRGHSHF